MVRVSGLRFSTYSIVARDPASRQLGVAVQTHQMCVGSAVPWLEAGVGAVATQSLTNVRFGPLGLALLRQGIEPERVVEALVASDGNAAQRQVALVDAKGSAAAWTGKQCIDHADHHVGDGYSVQANMMARPTVVSAMREAYETAEGELAQRMLAALFAAEEEEGDIRGMQSAALKVVPGDPARDRNPVEWRPLYDLRVDDADAPLEELTRLVRLRRATLIDHEGHRALEEGSYERALEQFASARELAPELGELVYWQALALAETSEGMEAGVRLLKTTLGANERAHHWRELLDRIERAGILSKPGAAVALKRALEANPG